MKVPPKWTVPGVRCVCAGRGVPAVGSAVSSRGVLLPVVRLFCPNFTVNVMMKCFDRERERDDERY